MYIQTSGFFFFFFPPAGRPTSFLLPLSHSHQSLVSKIECLDNHQNLPWFRPRHSLVPKTQYCLRETSDEQSFHTQLWSPYFRFLAFCLRLLGAFLASPDLLPKLLPPSSPTWRHRQWPCHWLVKYKVFSQSCLFKKWSLGSSTLKGLKPLHTLSWGGFTEPQ